jgi:cytochrome c oxidase cbb3-type subunit III
MRGTPAKFVSHFLSELLDEEMIMNPVRCLFVAILAGMFLFPLAASSQDPAANPTADDLARGKRLYVAQCSLCHGIEGVGGRGPSLNLPTLRRGTSTVSMMFIIKNGIPGTEMPAIWNLSDSEARLIAEYVRTLGQREEVKLTGDPTKGKAVFESQGCAVCHIVRGQGGSKGPVLTEIGNIRGAAHLREAIVDPGANVLESWLVVAATTGDGKTTRGVRVNEDSFTIQLRDTGNRFYSFRKADLKELKKETGISNMPSYKTLAAAELDDLVAYLASLRGEK